MVRSKLLAFSLILLATLFAVSCDTEEEKDPIKIRIFCYSSVLPAGFSGWYIKNGESPSFFTITTPQSGVYYTEIILEDVDELEIEVITLEVSSSLAIKIYKDDIKVKEASQDASTSPTIIRLNTTYTYGASSDTGSGT
jgi:hypothetical protein